MMPDFAIEELGTTLTFSNKPFVLNPVSHLQKYLMLPSSKAYQGISAFIS